MNIKKLSCVWVFLMASFSSQSNAAQYLGWVEHPENGVDVLINAPNIYGLYGTNMGAIADRWAFRAAESGFLFIQVSEFLGGNSDITVTLDSNIILPYVLDPGTNLIGTNLSSWVFEDILNAGVHTIDLTGNVVRSGGTGFSLYIGTEKFDPVAYANSPIPSVVYLFGFAVTGLLGLFRRKIAS